MSDKPISPLRRRMIEEMTLRNFVEKTHNDYIRHVRTFTAFAGHVSLGQLKVMSAIESCRTVALGGHVMRCEDCSHTQIAYNSCRNRHCPKCQGSQALAWMKQRTSELPAGRRLLPRRIHAAGANCRHRLPEQGHRLRSLVQGFLTDNAHDCGRSQAPGRPPIPRCSSGA